MTKISMDFGFSAAHHLPMSKGRCEKVHGHNYKLRVTLAGEPDPRTGMIMDFYALQEVVEKRVISELDHTNLNDLLENPTAELIAAWIWRRLEEDLPELFELILWEVTECFVTYRGPSASERRGSS